MITIILNNNDHNNKLLLLLLLLTTTTATATTRQPDDLPRDRAHGHSEAYKRGRIKQRKYNIFGFGGIERPF